MLKLVISLTLISLTLAVQTVLKDDPAWNYDNHGNDWDQDNCIDLTWSSPRDLSTTDTSSVTVDWDDSMFAFLTGFTAADITADQNGIVDYVYKVYNFTDGALGGWYAAEPMEYSPNFEIFFQINETRLHQPAEHTIDGNTYDAEFQIFGRDTRNQAFFCQTGIAAISMLLKVDDSQTENAFWGSFLGQDTYTYDLSQLVPKTYAMSNNIIGYKGGDTQPPCNKVCWYVLTTPFYISTDTLTAIQTANNNVANNRDVQNADLPYNAQHIGLFNSQSKKTEL